MTEKEMAGIIGQAMNGPLGEALGRYFSKTKVAEEQRLRDNYKDAEWIAGRLAMLYDVTLALNAMWNVHGLLDTRDKSTRTPIK